MSAAVAGLRLAPPRGAVAHRGRAAARAAPAAPSAPRAARPAPRLRAPPAAMRASAAAAGAPLAAGAPEPAVAAASVPRRKVAVFVEPSPFSHTSGMKNRFLNLISNLTDQGDEVRGAPAAWQSAQGQKAAPRHNPACACTARCGCAAAPTPRGAAASAAWLRAPRSPRADVRCGRSGEGSPSGSVHWPARLAPPLRFK